MPYVVTQACCADASCVIACPVNCIHPAPGEPGFAEAEMVYVDPASCVDCGACMTACPVDAIQPHTALTQRQLPFIALNASYFQGQPHLQRAPLAPLPVQAKVEGEGELRVAIVGAGPAAMYAADHLLKNSRVTCDVYDRLPTPYGLVRAGVAPDHQSTKKVTKLFDTIERQPGFNYLLNVEVGRHISHDELVDHYHGVIYAVGASADRPLVLPGADLAGSVSATSVVGWYNGHPDHENAYVDLGSERVVIVGNGNVALDVARILTADPETLAATDIGDHPLGVLRGSLVREVVVLGRRGPAEAACTLPELIGLAGLADVDVLVDNGGEPIEVTSAKTELLAELARREPTPGRRRVVLRFRTAPVRIVGGVSVDGIEVCRTELRVDDQGVAHAVETGDVEHLSTGLVLRSIGYRGLPVAGLPFDATTGTVPNDRGRVAPGTYVAGWIKRGPNGFIGTNKTCAEETVQQLVVDFDAGRLGSPTGSSAQLEKLLRAAQPEVVDLDGWRAIDRTERERGVTSGRVREKISNVPELVRAAERPPKRRRVAARRVSVR